MDTILPVKRPPASMHFAPQQKTTITNNAPSPNKNTDRTLQVVISHAFLLCFHSENRIKPKQSWISCQKEQGAQTKMDNETNHLSLMLHKVFLNVSMCDVNNTRVMVTELSAVDVGNDAFVVDGAAKSVKDRVPATCHARGTEEGLP